MFNIANIFTAGNLMSGIVAIILSLVGRIDLAPYAIILGAIFDFFDGFLARKLKVTGEFGKQLDSLADMVTFGVAPGVMMMVVLSIAIQPNLQMDSFVDFSNNQFNNWVVAITTNADFGDAFYDRYMPLLGLVIPFFSLFRLAKFNLDTRQSDSFIGLPTPANTLFFLTYPLVLKAQFESKEWVDNILFEPLLIGLAIVLMSALLVSEIPLFSLKFKNFKWRGNQIRFSFLLISLIFILTYHVWSIALIVFLYLILSVIENALHKKKRHEI